MDMNEASKRWVEEGRKFKLDLNAWLEIIYSGEQPSDPEPEDTREDMGELVLGFARQLNAEGRADELRELFPPAHEPFDYEAIGPFSIQQALLLKDGRVVVSAATDEGRKTFVLEGNDVHEQEGVVGVSRSAYHEVIGKAYLDRLDVHESWDGPVVRSLPWPTGYGDVLPEKIRGATFESLNDIGLSTLSMFPDGKRAVLAGDAGVFLISETGSELLHPTVDRAEELSEYEEDDEPFVMNLSYPHAAVSPDGSVIAVGVQDPPHRLLQEKDGAWVTVAEVWPRSSYPHAALFHDAKPHVALAGCHFAGSATVGLQLERLPKPGKDPLSVSGYDGDEELDYIDDRFWIFAIAPIDEGYVLGANNGYLWAHAFDGRKQLWFCHLGSTMTAMDISEDRKTLIVGTYSGQVIQLRLGDGADKAHLISDHEIREERRWVFWPGGPPMAW